MWRRLNLCPDNGTTLEPCNSSRVKVRYHALIGIYCYLICILHYSDIQSFAFPPPSHIETFISPSSHIETFISPSSHIETFISPFSHIETYISLSSRIWPPNSLSQTYTVSPLLNDLLCSSPPPISPCPPLLYSAAKCLWITLISQFGHFDLFLKHTQAPPGIHWILRGIIHFSRFYSSLVQDYILLQVL